MHTLAIFANLFHSKLKYLHGAALGLYLMGGCAPVKLRPPAGFVEVQNHPSHIRMKAQDRLGLSVRVFENYKGGTLAFWSEDLVRKLGMRGYQLNQQNPVKSQNRVVGTQFDFTYQQDSIVKFYTSVLFVTDKYLVVLQLAGDADQGERVRQQIPQILTEFKVRGCHAGSKICKGPQPSALSTKMAPADLESPPGATEENPPESIPPKNPIE